ncbi:glycosyltransferase involved in cell wall biosynthesis [Lachnotalea glycerini]|uniref:Glycosyltransferase involved in cell wall biosynthesis n=1 Tax=Lachnotalea glycerini TaxID=1763509 RepID=A0A318EMU0_9FIRM|nr:glycosyltransferase family A protein [Lachnotalea glycerini]PXV91459.1 glycosyltransferase involved in cell wall biosynthesis [Lachnotalea glycerini]
MNQLEKNKVSIIVPVYNGEKYLEKTLSSILASIYRNIEIVLVDDGSKDKSKQICDYYASKDNRVKVFSKINGGIVEARNFGMLKATGDYLCFCDQDDIVSKHMYDLMMKRILKDNSEICISSTGRLLGKEELPYEKLEDATYKGDEILQNVLYPILFNGFDVAYKNKKVKIYGTIWKYMISRELIIKNKLKFKRFINYEDDLIMSIELLTFSHRVSTLSEKLYFWRINQESESSTGKYIKALEDKIESLDQYIISILYKRGIDNKIIEQYKEIKQLNNYLQIIENENNTNKRLVQKKSILVKYIDNTNSYNNMKNLEFMSKGHVRSWVLLKLIRFQFIRCVFIVDKVLIFINMCVLKAGWLVRLERKMKGV